MGSMISSDNNELGSRCVNPKTRCIGEKPERLLYRLRTEQHNWPNAVNSSSVVASSLRRASLTCRFHLSPHAPYGHFAMEPVHQWEGVSNHNWNTCRQRNLEIRDRDRQRCILEDRKIEPKFRQMLAKRSVRFCVHHRLHDPLAGKKSPSKYN